MLKSKGALKRNRVEVLRGDFEVLGEICIPDDFTEIIDAGNYSPAERLHIVEVITPSAWAGWRGQKTVRSALLQYGLDQFIDVESLPEPLS
jgi:hypothetical protein